MMSEWSPNVEMVITGTRGPARSQEEADEDAARDRVMIEEKHARLAELRAGFEAEGHAPDRARVFAAQSYRDEVR